MSYKIYCTSQPDIIHQLVKMKFMVLFLLLSAYFAATFAGCRGKIFSKTDKKSLYLHNYIIITPSNVFIMFTYRKKRLHLERKRMSHPAIFKRQIIVIPSGNHF
jgi:hypothetical protein